MKNLLKKLVFFLFAGALVFSSCDKDKFTEEDALEVLKKLNLHIGVRDASNSDAAIAGAEVKAIIDTTVVTATTNANGVAIFKDVNIGNTINVTVSKDQYTTVFSAVNTQPEDYRQTVVTENVFLYSLSGDNIATVTGKLTIETDLTNRQRESVEGVDVLAYNEDLGVVPGMYGNDKQNGVTRYFVGTTDATGTYSISVPVDSDGGNDIEISFPSIEKDRTVGRDIENVYSIEVKKAVYVPGDYNPSAVEVVPSALIGVAAPPVVGSGFQLGLEADRNSLSSAVDNEGTDAAIVSGGSGYELNDYFVFAADPDGRRAYLRITGVDDGIITSVSIENNQAEYSSFPGFDTLPAKGTGAEFDLRFRTRYRVYITNSGSGYLDYPQVGVEYTSGDPFGTSRLMQKYDSDLDDGNVLGGSNIFNYTIISDGEIIVGDQADGDTLFTTNYLYSLPSFVYTEEDAEQTEWYFAGGFMDDSTLTQGGLLLSNGVIGNGYDYSNPPAVTVTGLAGYGSGAEVKAVVNSDGEVNGLVLMKRGTGYTEDVNDYDGDENYGESEGGELTGFNSSSTGWGMHQNVKPGMTYIGDVYYGTGTVRERDN